MLTRVFDFDCVGFGTDTAAVSADFFLISPFILGSWLFSSPFRCLFLFALRTDSSLAVRVFTRVSKFAIAEWFFWGSAPGRLRFFDTRDLAIEARGADTDHPGTSKGTICTFETPQEPTWIHASIVAY